MISSLAGYDVVWRSWGEGPVDVVLVHGIGASGRYFAPLAAQLAGRVRVVVLDLPGFGASPRADAPLSVAEHARVVAALVERLGPRRTVLVGHSMGAQVVTEVALRRPALVEGLVLVGPVADQRARSAVRLGLRLLRDARHEPLRVTALQVREWWRAGPRWFLATVPHMVDHPTEQRLEQVSVPIVLARGEHDPVAPADHLIRLAGRVPTAGVLQVPGAGHVAMYRRPQHVADAALRLAGLRAGADQPGRRPPRPTPALAVRAVWRVRDLAYVVCVELAVLTRPDTTRLREPSVPRPPHVVLVPGVYEHWTVLRRAAKALHAAGHPVHVLPGLGNNRRPIDEGAAVLLRHLERADLTGVVVVAHSKGGLIAKLAMARQAEPGRLVGVVAVATPFAGSDRAGRVPLAAVRELLPDDPLIVALAEQRSVDGRVVSAYSRYDPHIPAGSRLEGAAANLELDTPGHFRVLADPALPSLLVQWVRRLGAAASG